MSNLLKTIFFGAAAGLLISCGGGSNSSAGSSNSGGSTGSLSNTSFPSSFSGSVQENEGGPFIQESFLFNAPSDELPTNVSITGPDADLFIVFIEASPTTAANGDRTIFVTVEQNPDTTVFSGFNFERPQDADLNNFYEFTVSATYQGGTISSDYNLTITDDPTDPAELTGGGFFTSLTGQVRQASIPDITGDGLEELVVTFAGDTAYVVGSEGLSTTSNVTDITQDGNHILRFDLGVDSPNRAPRVSAIENAAGDVEVLISSAEARQAVLYRIPQSQRDGSFIEGTIDISSANANVGIIDMPDAFHSSLGEWVDDINGDGRPDIFFGGDGSNGTRSAGLLFDTASLFNTDSLAQFDVLVSHDVSTTLREILGITVVEDLDGDGVSDVFFYGPALTSFVSGSHLLAPGTTNVQLSSLSSDEGLTYEDGVGDVALYPDHNNDGFPTLILPPRQGSSFSARIVDASTFLQGSVNGLTSIPAQTISATILLGTNADGDPVFGTDTLRGPVTILNDMNGDGAPEVHFITFPTDGVIISGAVIGTALDEFSNGQFSVPPTEGLLLRQLGVLEQGDVFGGDGGLIIGDIFLLNEAGCSFGATGPCSGSSAWSLTDISDNFANGASEIILR